jgi:hypothetical protein
MNTLSYASTGKPHLARELPWPDGTQYSGSQILPRFQPIRLRRKCVMIYAALCIPADD